MLDSLLAQFRIELIQDRSELLHGEPQTSFFGKELQSLQLEMMWARIFVVAIQYIISSRNFRSSLTSR